MFKKLIIQFLILALAFLLLWFLFFKIKSVYEGFDFSLSVQNETKVGDKLIGLMLETEQVIESKKIDSALAEIQFRLEKAIVKSPYTYKFHLVDKQEVNAFAFPGGHIVIYSGLIKRSESAEELASVLAHEMGHIEKRHVVKHLIKNLGLSVVLSLMFSDAAPVIGEMVMEFASNVFSREQEEEADVFALNLLEKAKIHPHVFGDFLKKLPQDQMSGKLDFLSTHPNTEKRMQMAYRYKVKKEFYKESFLMNWEEVKKEIGIPNKP